MAVHRLTFDEHTVTAEVTPHGTFTCTLEEYEDALGHESGTLYRAVFRYYRDEGTDLPREVLAVMAACMGVLK